MNGLRIVASVVRDRRLRRVLAGLFAFSASEAATWLAITVFAYERGGVGEAGFVVFLQLAVAAIVVPFVSFIADRYARNRVLAGGYGAQAAAFIACGLAIAGDAHVGVVYALATVAAVFVTFSRPTAAAVVPSLVSTPAELTAANVASSFALGFGMFAGPAVGGILLTVAHTGTVFVVAGVVMLAAFASTLRLHPGALLVVGDTADEAAAWSQELVAGLSWLRRDRSSRLLVGLLTLSWGVMGAMDLAFVAVAIDLLDRSEASAGLFTAAFGIGEVLGAAGAVALVKRRRLTRSLAIGVLIAGAPIAALAVSGNAAIAAVLFVAGGIGFTAVDISGRTMLQGSTPDDTLARVFGLLEGLSMAGLALGGLWFAGLAQWLGLRAALVIVGLALPVFVGLRIRTLSSIDASRPEVDPALLGFVRAVPIFAPLPVYAVEQLLVNLVLERYAPADEVFRKGDAGDRFYLVASGSAEIYLDGIGWLPREPGDFFGEIALLRDVPRTATVRSGPQGMTVHTLERDVFLAAVTGSRRSLTRLEATVSERLDGSI